MLFRSHGASSSFRSRTSHLPLGRSETGIATRQQMSNLGVDVSRSKYEEFIPWWKANWQKGVPTWHQGKVTEEQWLNADYGISRLRGMVRFAKSEDWSNRLPEMKEYLEKLDAHRGTNFYTTFPEMKDIFK